MMVHLGVSQKLPFGIYSSNGQPKTFNVKKYQQVVVGSVNSHQLI